MNVLDNKFKEIGTAIGEGYAKQGKSWDEVDSMPSSGSGPGKDAMYSSAKTAYDNYMTKNKPAPVSTSSANMIQSPGGSYGGLAGSAVGTESMNANPMLNNGLGSLGQNNTNDTGISGFGNMSTAQKSNGLGNIVGYNPQGNNYNIIGGVELV